MSDRLQAWIDTKTHWKVNVRNYCQGWFNEGLSDRPISRDLDWGVALPIEDAVGKVMYVWFENTLGLRVVHPGMGGGAGRSRTVEGLLAEPGLQARQLPR